MSFNVKDAVPVPLQVFSGLVTEMAPDALPEGVSPDCQEMQFVPGSAFSRACLQKIAANYPFTAGSTVTYAKSFVDPTGNVTNLYLDSAGAMWSERFSTEPGVYGVMFQTTPGSYGKSVTADGREYIAISDGLHGQEVPIQYDGTYYDRVTQDGPGTPPTVTNVILPPVTMAGTGAPPTTAIVSATPSNLIGGGFTTLNIVVASVGSAMVGQTITISGNSSSALNATFSIAEVLSGPELIICNVYLPSTTAAGTGGTGTYSYGNTMIRQNSIVTVGTATPHQLQPGFQVQITNVDAFLVGGNIASITISNEANPGLATVTTNIAHGLVANEFVTMTNIGGNVVGGTITGIARQGDIVTVNTSLPHGLSPGTTVTIAGVSLGSFNTTTAIASVASSNVFTFVQVDSDATSSGGTVTLDWPILDTATPNYYQVVAVPTPTTFTVAINYADGTWTGGTISFAWQGTFFVLSVPSTTSFTYTQYGPNATTAETGTVTPYGQAAPGLHQFQLTFLTRQGAITEPSPPVTVALNGGQYVGVSNIATGPENIVARIILVTGAGGSNFYYIPVPAQENGQIVSTSTQVDDNATTSVLLDFSDNTLFRSICTSIPGNNLPNQIVLDSALGFGSYASRLITWGQRNCVQNFLNLGFDGGSLATTPTLPTGWSVNAATPSGQLVNGHLDLGQAWQIPISNTSTIQYLSQGAYQDAYGAPIIQPNTAYKIRLWISNSNPNSTQSITFQFYSPSQPFYNLGAGITGAMMTVAGGWVEVYLGKTSTIIPSDYQFRIYGNPSVNTCNIVIDEVTLVYSENPYVLGCYGSYVNNPEGMDGLTGYFGPTQDTRTVMDMGIIRNSLYLLTRDPSGRLHQTADNGTTEPSGWTVSQIASNCGSLSAFGLTKSQADDETGSGGEEWFSWPSSTGYRIFGGDQPFKISQEIQPNWTGDPVRGFQGINFAAALTIWSINDTVNRVIYIGIPSLDVAANPTAPNVILPMNYRELDSAYDIAKSPPIRASYTGRLIATDNTRKWTRWNLAINGAAMMYRGASLSLTFFAGNGAFPNTLAGGYANCYTLNPLYMTDEDYGQIYPWYVTYGFVSRDQEQALQLGSVRKILAYATAFIKGTGVVQLNYFADSLQNQWPLSSTRSMVTNPTRDMNFAGGNVVAERIFLKFASYPAAGSVGNPDNSFALSKCMAAMRPAGRLSITGAA